MTDDVNSWQSGKHRFGAETHKAGHVGSIPIARLLLAPDSTCQDMPNSACVQWLRRVFQMFLVFNHPLKLPTNDPK